MRGEVTVSGMESGGRRGEEGIKASLKKIAKKSVDIVKKTKKKGSFMQQEWRHDDDDGDDDEAGFLILRKHSSDSKGRLSAQLAER